MRSLSREDWIRKERQLNSEFQDAPPSLDWVLGFLEGEGSFQINIHRSPRHACGYRAYVQFALQMAKKEEGTLRKIAHVLERQGVRCKVYERRFRRPNPKWSPVVTLDVWWIDECKKLRDLLLPLSWHSSKKWDFQIWSDCIDLLEKHRIPWGPKKAIHYTTDLIYEISKLRERMSSDRGSIRIHRPGTIRSSKIRHDEGIMKDWTKKEERHYSTLDTHVTADALKSPIQRQRIDTAIELMGRAGLVLDLGANDGGISELAKQHGNEVVAVDFPKVIGYAKGRGVHLVGANAQFLPFKQEIFDGALFCETIEHMVELDPVMDQLRQVLKPGGKLVITTPNVARLRNRIELLRGQHTMGWFQHLEPIRHVRYYTHLTLADYLSKMGFKPTRLAGGESEGGGVDWSGVSDEERDVIMRVINRLTPEPRELLLGSFVVLEALKE